VPKRRERVAPPPAAAGWDFRYGTSAAVEGWDEICSAAPANARVAWEKPTEDPRTRTERQHPLRGNLGTRDVSGQTMEQWQYEVTAGGRLWYCIDDNRRTVWLMDAMVGHPKATE
jgi:hypothetical protein